MIQRIAAPLCALLLAPQAPAAQESVVDSLAYAEKRGEILALGELPEEYAIYLEAGEELAREGMHAEAHDLLTDLFAGLLDEPDDTAGYEDEFTAPAHDMPALTDVPDDIAAGTPDIEPADPLEWQLSAALSYDVFDDNYLVSTTGDTFGIDTALALDEIDDQPLNGNARVELAWNTGVRAVETISPYVYLSNTRGRLGVETDGSFVRDWVTYELAVEGEKKLGEDYGDSSDLARADARLEISSRPLEKIMSALLPVEFEGEYYRTQRSQYTSFAGVTASPTLELESKDFRKRAAFSGEIEYLRYHAAFDEDTEIRYGPRVVADLWANAFDAGIDLSYNWERYPRRHDPRLRRGLDGVLRFSIRPVGWLEGRIDASGLLERECYLDDSVDGYTHVTLLDSSEYTVTPFEYYSDTTLVSSYTLDGYGGEATAALEFFLPLGFSIIPSMYCEQRRYPRKSSAGDSVYYYLPLSISESYMACEPEAGIGFEQGPVQAGVAIAYRMEDIIHETYLEDSRSYKPSAEIQWSILTNLTIDATGEYEHRILESGLRENNISAYLSVSARF
ncbi:MAG: hypothetical protein GF418_14030 [Chitinivibrionales bacterium]|nr:hypothetical protein [Chitinivibrionales bacterium]MBD3396737.1 hypothetical protein [Chitinivibrionales bacterium]